MFKNRLDEFFNIFIELLREYNREKQEQKEYNSSISIEFNSYFKKEKNILIINFTPIEINVELNYKKIINITEYDYYIVKYPSLEEFTDWIDNRKYIIENIIKNLKEEKYYAIDTENI